MWILVEDLDVGGFYDVWVVGKTEAGGGVGGSRVEITRSESLNTFTINTGKGL